MLQNPNAQLSLAGGMEVLAELLAGAVGTTAVLHLFKQGFNPSAASTPADFAAQECDFTGYAEHPIVWNPVALTDAGLPALASDDGFFQLTGTTITNVVGGGWVEIESDAGPPAVTEVLVYFTLASPVNLQNTGQYVNVNVTYTEPSNASFAVVES